MRLIVKKFFGTLPIFYSCLECQHFVLIMFLTQGKVRIACCEHFFANQPRWAAVDGHDVTPISFTKYLAEILLDVLTNFQWLIKLGLWPDNRMNFL